MLRVLKPEDTERICLFGAQVFCEHEPMCKALGATVPEFVQQFTPIIQACCSSGLSYALQEEEPAAGAAAGSGAGGEFLSMSLALTYAQYSSIQLDEHPTFRPVLAVFDALDAMGQTLPDSNNTNNTTGAAAAADSGSSDSSSSSSSTSTSSDSAATADDDDGVVMCFMWATHSAHMNKGYTKMVARGTLQAAQQAGCRSLMADFTNVVSQHLMGHFGYQPSIKVRYHDYECFKSIQCTEYVVRAIKPLRDCCCC